MLLDNQYQYNALVLGSGANHGLTVIEGIGLPGQRISEAPRPEDHGAFIHGAFSYARRLMLAGTTRAASGSTLEAAVTELRQAFVPRVAPIPFTFKLRDDVEKRIYCIPTRGPEFPIDSVYGTAQRAKWAIELTAEDPLIYAEAASSLVITPGTPPGGVDFSVDFDLNFGGGSSVSGNANNAGIVPTAPVARLDGPFTNPKIQNDVTGEFIRLNITVADGSFIEIDFAKRTIKLDGTASRYNTLDEDSTWWKVQAGNNTIQYIVSGAGANTKMTLTWRSAWI